MAWSPRLWILNILGIVGLLIAMAWNLLWQSPPEEELNAALFPSPLGEEFLNSLAQMTLNNSQGEFVLVNNGDGRWNVTSPGEFPVDPQILPKIRQALGPWEIIKVFRKGPKMPENTGLDSPFASVSLVGQDQTRKEVKWGITNPVNRSTFIEIKGGAYIYQIKSSDFSLGEIKIEQLRVLGPWAQLKNPQEIGQIVWSKQGSDLMIWNDQHPNFGQMKELRASSAYAPNTPEFLALDKVLKQFPGGTITLTIPSMGEMKFLVSNPLSQLRPIRQDLPQGHLILSVRPGQSLYVIDEKALLTTP